MLLASVCKMEVGMEELPNAIVSNKEGSKEA